MMDLDLALILGIIGAAGTCVTCIVLLHKMQSTKRVKRIWGNIKRTTIHRVRFVRGWGYHGDVFYRAHSESKSHLGCVARGREFITKSEPDYVLMTIPSAASSSGPLVFTKMHIFLSGYLAQFAFTCELNEAIVREEGFRAISFNAGNGLSAASWSSSRGNPGGWKITDRCTRLTIESTDSCRILSKFLDVTTVRVDVSGFRGPSIRTVGRFNLGKALDIPAKGQARGWTTDIRRLVNEANDGGVDPTDGNAVIEEVLDAIMGPEGPQRSRKVVTSGVGVSRHIPDSVWKEQDQQST